MTWATDPYPGIRGTTLMATIKVLLVLGISFFTLSSLYAYESIAVPEWTLQLVDSAGKPVEGALVMEEWRDSSFESQSHRIERTSDKNGFVKFPPATVSASLIGRIMGRWWQKLTYFPHEGHGVNASAMARTGDIDTEGSMACYVSWSSGSGQPLPTRIICSRAQK